MNSKHWFTTGSGKIELELSLENAQYRHKIEATRMRLTKGVY